MQKITTISTCIVVLFMAASCSKTSSDNPSNATNQSFSETNATDTDGSGSNQATNNNMIDTGNTVNNSMSNAASHN